MVSPVECLSSLCPSRPGGKLVYANDIVITPLTQDPAGALKKQHSHVPMTADNLTTGAAR